MKLEIMDGYCTQSRGSNDAEYQIYVAAAEDLGWTIKTYEEWLNS